MKLMIFQVKFRIFPGEIHDFPCEMPILVLSLAEAAELSLLQLQGPISCSKATFPFLMSSVPLHWTWSRAQPPSRTTPGPEGSAELQKRFFSHLLKIKSLPKGSIGLLQGTTTEQDQ